MKTCLILTLGILFVFSCDHSDDDGCLAKVLKEHDMVLYHGQDTGCSTYLKLYTYNGEQYFMLGNNCADMAYYFFDCNGRQICDTESQECTDLAEHAVNRGIVGISK